MIIKLPGIFGGETLRMYWEYERDIGLKIQGKGIDVDALYSQTVCTIEVIEDGMMWNESSLCAPSDQFCKRVGRKLSFSRALNQVADYYSGKISGEFTSLMKKRELRSQVWNEYKKQMPNDFK